MFSKTVPVVLAEVNCLQILSYTEEHLSHRQFLLTPSIFAESLSMTVFRTRMLGCFGFVIATLAVSVAPSLRCVAQDWAAEGKQGMVASVHPLATKAGLRAMELGGNAVDAAIAAGLMLGVVDSHNSGLGGGCFILIRAADGTVIAIDGREMAPAAANPALYLKDGKPDTSLSQTGPLASGVPGALAAYQLALERHGKLKLAQVIEPATNVAAAGFPIDSSFARKLRDTKELLSRFEGAKAVYFNAQGETLNEGDTLKQPDLARTYSAIAKDGVQYFYHGDFAKQTAAWMQANGGVMTEADFANYRPIVRKPLRTTYRGYEIVGFPPPSSGGVHVAQILNILEAFDLAKIHQESEAQWMHVVGEAMKLAFADRAYWLGDPDYVNVPRGLIDKGYAQELAKQIQLDRTIEVLSHGNPPGAETEFFEKHTTHITAADAEGNWVAMTQTVNTTFGSKVIVPGLGVVMNNEMDDFSIAPGVPNAFGLLGSKANEVAAGKRPLSSMSPTIVLKDGKPWFTAGAAGGPKIITQTLSMLLRRIDLNQPLPVAIAAPRLHHQWQPDSLLISESTPQPIRIALEQKGHKLNTAKTVAVVQAIEWAEGGNFIGVRDPAIPGLAAGR